MAQVVVHVCPGFLKGRGTQCANCGHPRKKHVDAPLNSAGFCRECVRLWRLNQEEAVRRGRLNY